VDKLTVVAIATSQILQEARSCSVIVLNQRLAVIHTRNAFLGHVPSWRNQTWRQRWRRPTKAHHLSRRDYAFLLCSTTSARDADAPRRTIATSPSAFEMGRRVRPLHTKGDCPLWSSTVQALASLVVNRKPDEDYQNRKNGSGSCDR
jgi:hypothetical protein